ncbi:MAG TPA: glycosyltransferase family 4 protein [Bacteroidia bacterium]|nr:glycosyltransferase family 4 protein [Bacteroidia bacterium]
MKKILWQSRSPVVFNSILSGKLIQGANGGNAYDFHAAMALKKNFKVIADGKALFSKSDNILRYRNRMKSYSPEADIIIKEPYPIVFGKNKQNAKQVALIHHIDDALLRKSLKHRLYFGVLKKQLRKMDLIVTVSKYWKDYLQDLGCGHIKIIYNSFNAEDYSVSKDAVSKFKIKYNLSGKVPLIYIGNAHRQKGAYEVYEKLKNKNYQLVMTGSVNYAKDLPVKFLSLSQPDYIALLHAANVVVTMSTMTEGWNRIAHEALLCRTPVIGSGAGGMKELLDESGQQIVQDISALPSAIEESLKNKDVFAEKGFAFASRFNSKYFTQEWITAIQNLL